MHEEAIATVVAVANRCRYGVLTHVGFFRRHSGDSGLASQLPLDYTRADLPPAERRMLDFAVRLTLEPASLTEKDVAGLRAAGFEDQDILSIVLVTCLFNFMNRVASSLGVEVPPSLQRVAERWLTGSADQQAWLLNSVEEQPQGPPDEGRVLPDDLGDADLEGGDEPSPDPEDALTEESGRSSSQEPAKPRTVERFVEECCVVSSDQTSPAKDLYIASIRWCDENQQRALLQGNFGRGLTALGFRRRRRGHGRHWWLGIGLEGSDA